MGGPDTAPDVDAVAQRERNAALLARLARTVWNTGGCNSWYRTRDGLNTTLLIGTADPLHLPQQPYPGSAPCVM